MTCPTTVAGNSELIRLTPIDLTYLHMESRSRPMHWALAIRLTPGAAPVTVDQLRDRVRDRSRLFTVFGLGVQHGRWRRATETLAADWDAGAHANAVSVDDEASLLSTIAGLMQGRLRGPKPMWDVTLVTRRDTQTQLILLRVHHCLSDGIAGAAFAALLADADNETLREFDRFGTSPRFCLEQPSPDIIRQARRALLGQWRGAKQWHRWPRLTRSGRREIALYSFSTREIRRAALDRHASVHEYLLAVAGCAISVSPPSARAIPRVRVALPVTLDSDMRHTGNAVAVGLVNLSGSERRLETQLACVRDELLTVQHRRPELALSHLATVGQRLPWAVQRIVTKATMAVLNPEVHIGVNPSYSSIRSVWGHRIADIVPLSPLAGYSLSVTILLLGDRTTFGIVADGRALPGYAETFKRQLDQALSGRSSYDHPSTGHHASHRREVSR
jgi:diacylglycerol O-acyltransferase